MQCSERMWNCSREDEQYGMQCLSRFHLPERKRRRQERKKRLDRLGGTEDAAIDGRL